MNHTLFYFPIQSSGSDAFYTAVTAIQVGNVPEMSKGFTDFSPYTHDSVLVTDNPEHMEQVLADLMMLMNRPLK